MFPEQQFVTDDGVFVCGDVSLPLFLYWIVSAYLKVYKVMFLFLKLCLVSKEILMTEAVYRPFYVVLWRRWSAGCDSPLDSISAVTKLKHREASIHRNDVLSYEFRISISPQTTPDTSRNTHVMQEKQVFQRKNVRKYKFEHQWWCLCFYSSVLFGFFFLLKDENPGSCSSWSQLEMDLGQKTVICYHHRYR